MRLSHCPYDLSGASLSFTAPIVLCSPLVRGPWEYDYDSLVSSTSPGPNGPTSPGRVAPEIIITCALFESAVTMSTHSAR